METLILRTGVLCVLRFESETPILLCRIVLCGDIIEEDQREEHVECDLGFERNETSVKNKMLTENATVSLYMFLNSQ